MSTFALVVEPRPMLRFPMLRFLIPRSEGAGVDLVTVEQRVGDLQEALHASHALTYREAALAETFRTLAEEWRRATRFQSSLMHITANPAYREIVQLGEEIVPLLLGELSRQPEPWFAALREITGTDPVRPGQRGDMRAMAEAWLRWGRTHGFIR